MSKEKEAKVKIGNQAYLIVSDDDYLEEIRPGFEPETVRLFKSLINVNKTDYVLDVGANIGCTSILCGTLAEKVYAFEPSPTTFNFLRRNIQRSGLKNVDIQNFGLGATAGQYTLTFAPNNRSGGFVSNHTQASAGHSIEDVSVKTMDEFVKPLNLPRLNFIKIDVEGFEWSVVQGGKWSLEEYKPTVVLELNHWCLNAFQRMSIPDFFDHLRSVFPVLLAVDGSCYLDLHKPGHSYTVMYFHILHMRFLSIVAAFDRQQIKGFIDSYEHRFEP